MISRGFYIQESLGLPWAFLGGPTDRVGNSFHIFVCPLSKLCASDMHLHVREKRVLPRVPSYPPRRAGTVGENPRNEVDVH